MREGIIETAKTFATARCNAAAGRRKYISLAIRVLVASAAMILVFRNQNWAELRGVFSGVGIGHFVFTLIVFVFCQAGVALRWFLLLRSQLVQVNMATVVRLHFLGLFYNNLMPSSVGGDVLRAWYVSKHTERRFAAALSVVVDRTIGLFSIVIMAVLSYAFLVRDAVSQDEKYLADKTPITDVASQRNMALCLVAMLVVTFLVSLLHCRSRVFFAVQLRRVLGPLSRLMSKAAEAAVLYSRNPVSLLAAFGLTLCLQSLTIIAFWVLGSGMGISAGLRIYFAVFPTVWAAGALPISIAGIGILEGGIKVLFIRLAGVSSNQAVCLALCQRFVLVLASLPGAGVHLLGRHLPEAACASVQKVAGQQPNLEGATAVRAESL